MNQGPLLLGTDGTAQPHPGYQTVVSCHPHCCTPRMTAPHHSLSGHLCANDAYVPVPMWVSQGSPVSGSPSSTYKLSILYALSGLGHQY